MLRVPVHLLHLWCHEEAVRTVASRPRATNSCGAAAVISPRRGSEREIPRGKRAEPQTANERLLGTLRPLPQEVQVVPGHDLTTEIGC